MENMTTWEDFGPLALGAEKLPTGPTFHDLGMGDPEKFEVH